MENIKIIGIQHDILWKDKLKNIEILNNIIEPLEADIFLLPEMFATGFSNDLENIIDDNMVLNWLLETSKKKNCAIGGSVAVKENDHFFNRFYFIERDGKINYYDKRHLFSFANENKYFTAGKEKVIINYLGWRLCLQICYDLRFPVFQRNTEHYDVILNVANWPSSRIDAWNTLLKARAIENQCYTIGLNRTGIDGNDIQYCGSSHCFFADGKEISTLKENILTATLDRNELSEFRQKFPFLNDQDQFSIVL